MRNRIIKLLTISTLAFVVFCGSHARAVTISTAGSNVDLGSGWRTDSVVKNDVDGNGVLGSDGYFIVGTNERLQVPTYLTSLVDIGGTYGGNGSYASIDDPSTTPGATPSLIRTGTKNPSLGDDVGVFSFVTGAGAPATFRVGVLLDNTDGAGWTSSAVRLVQTVGGAATSALFNTNIVNTNPDWFYFDVTNAAAGDAFELRSNAGPNNSNCVGGLAFDSTSIAIEPPDPKSLWSVDIQGTGGTVMVGTEPKFGDVGDVWNAFEVQHHPSSVTNASLNLVSSDGAASPVTFYLDGPVSAYNGAGPLESDYLFIGAGDVNTNHSTDWSLDGLIDGAIYEMFVYGNSDGRGFDMEIDLDGDGILNDGSLFVGAAGMLFDSIVVGGSGEILGNMSRASGEANWSGFQLRLVSVPEPSTFALAALGLVGLGWYGRRRRKRPCRRVG